MHQQIKNFRIVSACADKKMVANSFYSCCEQQYKRALAL